MKLLSKAEFPERDDQVQVKAETSALGLLLQPKTFIVRHINRLSILCTPQQEVTNAIASASHPKVDQR